MNRYFIRNQCIDLGIISVNNDEERQCILGKISMKIGYPQEHQFRIAQEVVRHHAEVDLGTGH